MPGAPSSQPNSPTLDRLTQPIALPSNGQVGEATDAIDGGNATRAIDRWDRSGKNKSDFPTPPRHVRLIQ